MDELKVVAVIVTYHPHLETLISVINNIANQVFAINMVDNSINELSLSFIQKINENIHGKLKYDYNNNSGGIAKAQNIGIAKALEQDADLILFLDQDSIPQLDMISLLKEDFITLINAGYNLAAIGPNPINKHTGNSYDSRVNSRNKLCNNNFVEVSELQNSGSLISVDVLKDVGLMDETLFIDGVDYEWCWRANAKGYICVLTKNSELLHMLGEGDKYFFGIRIAISSPFRTYYQFRNYIYLSSKRYVPRYWKIKNGIKYLIKLVYYPLFVPSGTEYLKKMIEGIKAGFKLCNKV